MENLKVVMTAGSKADTRVASTDGKKAEKLADMWARMTAVILVEMKADSLAV
jgi:hypothetical protein